MHTVPGHTLVVHSLPVHTPELLSVCLTGARWVCLCGSWENGNLWAERVPAILFSRSSSAGGYTGQHPLGSLAYPSLRTLILHGC